MWGELSSEWGELSSEGGASCLGASFLWGELSWGELSLGRVVRNSFGTPRPILQILILIGPRHFRSGIGSGFCSKMEI